MESLFGLLLNHLNLDSSYDFYFLFLIVSTIIFLLLSFFLISDFYKKIFFMILSLLIMLSVQLFGSFLPGTAKNLEYILEIKKEYDYIHHFVLTNNNKKYMYYVLLDKEINKPVLIVKKFDEKETKNLDNLLNELKAKFRNDQSKSKGIKMEIERKGVDSFETKFEMYDIDVPVLPPKMGAN